MYVSGGSNVYPREIERRCPNIREVAVVGVPDRKCGEVGIAVCVVRPGSDEDAAGLLAWLFSRLSR